MAKPMKSIIFLILQICSIKITVHGNPITEPSSVTAQPSNQQAGAPVGTQPASPQGNNGKNPYQAGMAKYEPVKFGSGSVQEPSAGQPSEANPQLPTNQVIDQKTKEPSFQLPVANSAPAGSVSPPVANEVNTGPGSTSPESSTASAPVAEVTSISSIPNIPDIPGEQPAPASSLGPANPESATVASSSLPVDVNAPLHSTVSAELSTPSSEVHANNIGDSGTNSHPVTVHVEVTSVSSIPSEQPAPASSLVAANHESAHVASSSLPVDSNAQSHSTIAPEHSPATSEVIQANPENSHIPATDGNVSPPAPIPIPEAVQGEAAVSPQSIPPSDIGHASSVALHDQTHQSNPAELVTTVPVVPADAPLHSTISAELSTPSSEVHANITGDSGTNPHPATVHVEVTSVSSIPSEHPVPLTSLDPANPGSANVASSSSPVDVNAPLQSTISPEPSNPTHQAVVGQSQPETLPVPATEINHIAEPAHTEPSSLLSSSPGVNPELNHPPETPINNPDPSNVGPPTVSNHNEVTSSSNIPSDQHIPVTSPNPAIPESANVASSSSPVGANAQSHSTIAPELGPVTSGVIQANPENSHIPETDGGISPPTPIPSAVQGEAAVSPQSIPPSDIGHASSVAPHDQTSQSNPAELVTTVPVVPANNIAHTEATISPSPEALPQSSSSPAVNSQGELQVNGEQNAQGAQTAIAGEHGQIVPAQTEPTLSPSIAPTQGNVDSVTNSAVLTAPGLSMQGDMNANQNIGHAHTTHAPSVNDQDHNKGKGKDKKKAKHGKKGGKRNKEERKGVVDSFLDSDDDDDDLFNF